MNIPDLDNHYDELCTFANIEYTPAWYYKHFPGFFNVQCYRILAGWQGGVRSDEEYLKEGEDSSNQENKKRRIESEDTEEETKNGVQGEFQRAYTESVPEFQISGELPFSQP